MRPNGFPVQIVDDEDAGMYDKVTTPVSVWFGESEHTDEMEVDELPRSVHNAMDCDGDVDMISAPIRSDDGWATNVDMLDQDVDMTDLASRREAGRKPKAATVGPVPVSCRCPLLGRRCSQSVRWTSTAYLHAALLPVSSSHLELSWLHGELAMQSAQLQVRPRLPALNRSAYQPKQHSPKLQRTRPGTS